MKKKKILLFFSIFHLSLLFLPTSSLVHNSCGGIVEHEIAPTPPTSKTSCNVRRIRLPVFAIFGTSSFTSIKKRCYSTAICEFISAFVAVIKLSFHVTPNSVCWLLLECQGKTVTSFGQCITVNYCTEECKQSTT